MAQPRTASGHDVCVSRVCVWVSVWWCVDRRRHYGAEPASHPGRDRSQRVPRVGACPARHHHDLREPCRQRVVVLVARRQRPPAAASHRPRQSPQSHQHCPRGNLNLTPRVLFVRVGWTGGTCPDHWISRHCTKWPVLCWCATATRSRPPHWLYVQIPPCSCSLWTVADTHPKLCTDPQILDETPRYSWKQTVVVETGTDFIIWDPDPLVFICISREAMWIIIAREAMWIIIAREAMWIIIAREAMWISLQTVTHDGADIAVATTTPVRFDFDSTLIRRTFDARSTAYQRLLRSQRRDTGRRPATRSHADLFIYLGRVYYSVEFYRKNSVASFSVFHLWLYSV